MQNFNQRPFFVDSVDRHKTGFYNPIRGLEWNPVDSNAIPFEGNGESRTAKKRVAGAQAPKAAPLAASEATLRFIADDKMDNQVREFLDVVYCLAASDEDAALSYLFQTISKALGQGEFGFRFSKRILLAIDESRLTSTLLVGFLSITFPSRAFLHAERHVFFQSVYAKLCRERGEERTARLLNKYNAR